MENHGNREEAISMLEDLSNSKHQVITSLCVISQKGETYKEQIEYDLADVYFKKMTRDEIEKWVDSGKAYDKARWIRRTKRIWGAYRKSKWQLFYCHGASNS